jgi:hypothetical protein
MKKLIILSAVLIYTTLAAKSQTLPYRPFSQFNNDIGAYLLYNFDKRCDVYTGKTFAELMKEMELKPLEVSPMFETTMDISSETYIVGIRLGFKFSSTSHAYVPWKDDFITIIWKTRFEDSKYQELRKQYPIEKWVSQHFDFFKDIEIKKVRFREN